MMNTVRKSENLLPFPVISAAANGDTTAMCAILKHYEGYIAKLCTRTLKDDAGNTYSYVDVDLCQYFGQKKLKDYADFFSSSSSLCCGVI